MLSRPRRNRKTSSIRRLISENKVTADDLIMPLFLLEGIGIEEKIPSLPVAYRRTLDTMLQEIASCVELGIHAFILFPKVSSNKKDKIGSYAYDPDNFYLKAATTIKEHFQDITLISDVALDPYNSDGHDGIVENGLIVNDKTVEALAKMAVAQARAGFDIIGPSDMMDGRVEAIRFAMDDAGFQDTSIMSYTAKYASGFYGPFRDALGSDPVIDDNIPMDKKTYQMDPANSIEALLEAELDTMEGADFLMVKPAVHYLDVIALLKSESHLPIVAYHVSGECAMLLAASEKGWLDYNTVMSEALLSIKRAGADVIVTYFAKAFLELESGARIIS